MDDQSPIPAAAIEFHAQHPDITPEQYRWAKEMLLGSEVLKRKRIFLDTRFWLLIRDHLRGKKRNEQIGRVYDGLTHLVTSGRAVCPINIMVLGEVLKQKDRETRLATAELMDQLSESVAIQPELRRVRREVLSFVSRGLLGARQYPPLQEVVWTRPYWLLVGPDPLLGDWPRELRSAATKASIDLWWHATVVDFVRAADDWPLEQSYAELHDSFPQFVANELNAGRNDPEQDLGSFHAHFLAHLEVALEMHQSDIEDVLDLFFERQFGTTIGVSASETSRDAAPVTDWIRSAFREKRVGTELPYFQIIPAILAAFELDRARKYKRNDTIDFYNAATALPFCDIYLTESSFRHLLTTKPLAFDRLYGTQVISDPSEAAAAIEALASG